MGGCGTGIRHDDAYILWFGLVYFAWEINAGIIIMNAGTKGLISSIVIEGWECRLGLRENVLFICTLETVDDRQRQASGLVTVVG